MDSTVVRVHDDALKIAKKYDKNLSAAILKMDELIKTGGKVPSDKKVMVKIITGKGN